MPIPDLDNIEPKRLGELMARSRQLREEEQELCPFSVDGYEILGRLGEGGSGTVWRAKQLTTGRLVALKLLHASAVASFKARQRFEREVELTAQMAHPGIARLYDSGARRGIWYYAMELIDGLPLDQYVARQQISREAVLRLMIGVCRAVEHAHQHGIIHRDLKPSNILVTADGQPHVLDFGLARAAQDASAALTVSLQGEVAGTLGFMSPEQAAGRREVGTRSDVYSLGAILFLLLTGRTPHDLTGSSMEVARRIAEQDPIRPRQIDPRIDSELDAILLKSLAREPGRRYASVAELADDLDRYLRGDPLSARPPTLAYFVSRRVRQHRLPIAMAIAVIVAMAGMLIYTYVRITRERNAAVVQTGIARHERMLAEQSQDLADQRLADALLSQADAMAEANRWIKAKDLYRESWQKLESQHRPTFPAELGLFKAYQVAPPPLNEFAGSMRPIHATALSPDGKLVAAGGDDGVARVWDIVTARLLHALPYEGGSISALAFSPDSNRLACGGSEGVVTLFDLTVERKRWSYSQEGAIAIAQISFSPDGRKIASAAIGGGAVLLKADDGRLLSQLSKPGHGYTCVDFSPDGRNCVAGGAYGSLWMYDTNDGQLLDQWHAHRRDAWAVCFSPDGKYLLSGDGKMQAESGKLRLWDARSHQLLRIFDTSSTINRVAFSSDGKLAYSSGEGVVHAWDVQSGRAVRSIWGDGQPILNASFRPASQLVLSSADDGSVRLWDLRGTWGICQTNHGQHLYSLAIGPADDRIWVGQPNGLFVTNTTLRSKLTVSGIEGNVQCIAISRDGRLMLCGSSTGEVALFRADTGKKIITLGRHDMDAFIALFSPDDRLAVTANGNSAIIWDVASFKKLREFHANATLAHGGAIVDHGKKVLGMTVHGQIAGCRLDSLRDFDGAVMDVPRDVTSNVVFLHDGQQVLAGYGMNLIVFDVQTGRRLATFSGHKADIYVVCVSPDQKWMASAAPDGLRIWDLSTAQELQKFDYSTVTAMAWSRDGNRLYLADSDGRLSCMNFAFPDLYRQLGPQLAVARKAIQERPDDPSARAILSRWYDVRDRPQWSAKLK